jgi:hypothetical protein
LDFRSFSLFEPSFVCASHILAASVHGAGSFAILAQARFNVLFPDGLSHSFQSTLKPRCGINFDSYRAVNGRG